MKTIDIGYISRMTANLSGIPVRCYTGSEKTFMHSPIRLPADPVTLWEKDILETDEHIGYFVTPEFLFYGYIHWRDSTLVIGPTYQVMPSDAQLQKLAFQTDVSMDEANGFIESIKSIVSMPLESLLMMLCTINYILNDETKDITDIVIHESEQLAIKQQAENSRTAQSYDQEMPKYSNNSMFLEEMITSIVQRGDTAAFQQLSAKIPSVRGGIIAPDQLRQLKNTFVVTATVTSRAAIQGGLNSETALRLSDAYIQRMELLSSQEKITDLQYQMTLEYTERVERIRHGGQPSKIAVDTANYIQQHISEHLTTSQIAEAFYLSRTHFSARFKKETGMNLVDFLRKEKIEEAKRLLRYSDKSPAMISAYLGFSSHSYFIKVFRQFTGCTPNEYRQRMHKTE